MAAEPLSTDDIGAQLTGWGRTARITTTGRVSGRPVPVVVGFLEDADDAILVAAGDPDADWARNLESEPHCRVTVGDRSWDALAEGLEAAEAARLVTGLILKYGTSAEQLGRGPAFRVRPVRADSASRS